MSLEDLLDLEDPLAQILLLRWLLLSLWIQVLRWRQCIRFQWARLRPWDPHFQLLRLVKQCPWDRADLWDQQHQQDLLLRWTN